MSDGAVQIVVAGAGGRMGCAVVRAAMTTARATIQGGFERPGHPAIGRDLGLNAGLEAMGANIDQAADHLISNASAVIDFTTPAASVELARKAAQAGIAHIIGSTGFSPDQEAAIRDCAARIPVVKTGNFSLGVNLMLGAVRTAAAALDEDFDIEIFEAHHRNKIDAPSGTALMLGAAAAEGRGVDLDDRRVDDRRGARQSGDIGFSVFRGGGVIGDHTVSFASDEEVLTFSHHAIDRSLFARGAVRAAIWASDRPPGLYDMMDVLGFARGLTSA